MYCLGQASGKPDALIRWSEDLPKGGDETLQPMEQTVLKLKNLPNKLLSLNALSISLAGIRQQPPTTSIQRLPIITIGPRDISFKAKSIQDLEALPDVGLVVSFVSPPESPQSNSRSLLVDNAPPLAPGPQHTLEDQMNRAYLNNPLATEIFEALRTGIQCHLVLPLVNCWNSNGQLYYQDEIYVPDNDEQRLRIIQGSHDSPAAGHPGRERTRAIELLTRKYFWPTMRKDIERFVGNCHTCRRTKP